MTTFAVPVRFTVEAETLEEAREKVKILIEHGSSAHNGDVDWAWGKTGH